MADKEVGLKQQDTELSTILFNRPIERNHRSRTPHAAPNIAWARLLFAGAANTMILLCRPHGLLHRWGVSYVVAFNKFRTFPATYWARVVGA